ncbi:MAG: hypothetical protein H0W23_03570 [Chloroflexia bacterium]|nr:hypothetical protein [Chloroflexia bacterium]
MSEDDHARASASNRPNPVDATGEPELEGSSGAAAAVEDESTVGTGSAIAIGCIGATLVLIVLGLALLAVFALLR